MTEMVEGNEGIMVVFGLNRNFIVEDAHALWLSFLSLNANVFILFESISQSHWPLRSTDYIVFIYGVNYAMPRIYDQIHWWE